MKRPILQKENPLLRKRAKNVPEAVFDTPKLREIIKDMADTLDVEEDGVALAAPQIGILYRLFIVRLDRILPSPKETKKIKPKILVCINPTFVKKSRKLRRADEGCLSVRGLYGITKHHERATLRAYDEGGKVFTRGAGGLLAQIFEHETDHLNGILFIDHAEHVFEFRNEKRPYAILHES